jgi:hypothetical protein
MGVRSRRSTFVKVAYIYRGTYDWNTRHDAANSARTVTTNCSTGWMDGWMERSMNPERTLSFTTLPTSAERQLQTECSAVQCSAVQCPAVPVRARQLQRLRGTEAAVQCRIGAMLHSLTHSFTHMTAACTVSDTVSV